MSILTDWYKVKVTFVCEKTSKYTVMIMTQQSSHISALVFSALALPVKALFPVCDEIMKVWAKSN